MLMNAAMARQKLITMRLLHAPVSEKGLSCKVKKRRRTDSTLSCMSRRDRTGKTAGYVRAGESVSSKVP